MITISQLSKKYGGQAVLDLPNLEIPAGQCFGLVGNNGAGKTTLFSLILDLIRPTTGTVCNHGIIVSENEDWKKTTSAFIDESFLIGYLTPEEYFQFVADLRKVSKATLDEWLEQFIGFFNGEILNKKKYLRDFSKGNQKKVGIVAALIGMPQTIILDEPFANLDPTTQIRLKELISSMAQTQKTTFLISSHDLMHVTEVCNRIVLLEKGQLLKDIIKTPQTLTELEAYFKG
ncbi:MAG: ABC transporter ATP-binding protein [Bacteroidetes bacterium]|nr:ABC transporter ATP-binding protein [Bacteroidota bacterium]MDA0938144.1 ABC transporter ATP-binding protein [Bacteroidota bacterium]MDA1344516.1 ABC transporter ATP-binding protein [Bacteroidota bacterium]